MGEFASKGVAGAGLGTGIAGLTLGVLNSGANLMGNGWGGCGRNGGWGYNNCGNGNCFGTGFDISVSEALAQRDAQIARLEAKAYSDESDLTLYKYFDAKFKELDNRLCEQAVFNATATANITNLTAQLQSLNGLVGSITKTAIPESAICDFSGRSRCCTVTQQ